MAIDAPTRVPEHEIIWPTNGAGYTELHFTGGVTLLSQFGTTFFVNEDATGKYLSTNAENLQLAAAIGLPGRAVSAVMETYHWTPLLPGSGERYTSVGCGAGGLQSTSLGRATPPNSPEQWDTFLSVGPVEGYAGWPGWISGQGVGLHRRHIVEARGTGGRWGVSDPAEPPPWWDPESVPYEVGQDTPPVQDVRMWTPNSIGLTSIGNMPQPRLYRFNVWYEPLIATGMWTTAQRQTGPGNSGGWPLSQRQNGGHTGSWPLAQRQNGL